MQKYLDKSSIARTIISVYFWSFLKAAVLLGISQFCYTSMSLLMLFLLQTVVKEGPTEEEKIKTYISLYAMIVGAQFFGALLQNYTKCDLSRLSVRLKNAMIYAIYQKIVKVSVLNPAAHTEGNILNYIQIDAQKLEDAITKFSVLLESIWMVLFGFIISVYLVGFHIIPVIVIFFILTCITISLYRFIFKYEVRFMIAKDKRMQLLKNILSNIKYIKMRCWELFYHLKIYQKREAELKAMTGSNFFFCVVVALNWLNPTTAFLTTFISMLYFNRPLVPAELLGYMRIFTTILKGMGNLPSCVQFFIELKVSLRRLDIFFDSDDLNLSYIKREPVGSSVFAIETENGDFYWNRMTEEMREKKRKRRKTRRGKIGKFKNQIAYNQEELVMDQSEQSISIGATNTIMSNNNTTATNVTKQSLTQSLLSISGKEKLGFEVTELDLLIPRKKLTMIFGEIGSGKSSIIYSILGEMNPKYQDPAPKIVLRGEVYYLAQKPWLLGMSIKENVTLGIPFDRTKFNRAIHLAAMEKDLEMFPEREEKLISDGADNLSGGQKVRLGLARAFYQK